MPKVGTGKNAKHFAYSDKGMAAAKKEAARTGKPLEKAPRPQRPGR
jgi:hypothetical protein